MSITQRSGAGCNITVSFAKNRSHRFSGCTTHANQSIKFVDQRFIGEVHQH
jgi:hypothetical protein